ncbi:hypothetical protein ACWEPN_40040 [Nonomuraea wenchangensis]
MLNPDAGHARALGLDLAALGYGRHRYTGPDADGDPVDLQVWLHPAHGRWLRRLHADGVHPAWATSWGALAATWIASRLHLPDLPVIDVTAGPFRGVRGGVSTKRAAIAAYAAGRPLLWIDDEFGRLDSVWAEQRLVDERAGLATLRPATHPGRGLTVEQMEQADAWPAKTVPGGGHGVERGVGHRLGTTGEGNS